SGASPSGVGCRAEGGGERAERALQGWGAGPKGAAQKNHMDVRAKLQIKDGRTVAVVGLPEGLG
ncbi:MAG: hypothetical protein ACRDKW_18430, partial [Actinomycetota bacterium]